MDAAKILAQGSAELLHAASVWVVVRDEEGFHAVTSFGSRTGDSHISDSHTSDSHTDGGSPFLTEGNLSTVPDAVANIFFPLVTQAGPTPGWGSTVIVHAVPTLMGPLQANDRIVGALVVQRDAGTGGFAESEILRTKPFLEQAALTLVLADIQREHERLVVFEERDRIARDLHDLVIQRLFATGLLLRSAVKELESDSAVDRLDKAIDQLDVTVKEIRRTIFALQEPVDGPAVGLRGRIMHEVSQAALALSVTPSLRFMGAVDSSATAEITDQAVAAVRELLSNIDRHAQATRAEVCVCVVDEELVITVLDDGIGMGTGMHRSGLANIQARAVEHGGGFDIEPNRPSGTLARWHVPVAPRESIPLAGPNAGQA